MNRTIKPEQAIASWRQWSGQLSVRPEIIGHLDGGRSNRSLLLKSAEQKLVLRLAGNDKLLPQSTRSNEIKAWQAASAAGIAPPLLYASEQQGILVSAYIEHRLPAQAETNRSVINHAFALLKRCHQLDVDVPTLNLAEHIRQYWQLIEASGVPPDPALLKQRKTMQGMLDSPQFKNAKTGFCHHDPNLANFVGSPDQLYLLDWEYAANGLLVMDYAALAVEWGISDETVMAHSGADLELLAMAKKLYIYVCRLWEQVEA